MKRKFSQNIVIILARKNSKRIKNKNLVKINGIPLIEHSIKSAKEAKLVDEIYVSSDCKKIEKICKNLSVNYIKRPRNLAGDFVHSDEVLLDVIKKLNREININLIVFLQPTSPLRPKKILDRSILYFQKQKADSLFSSTLFKNNIWMQSDKLRPINYDFKKRKFEQEKNNEFNENGSFYIFKADKFLKFKNRLFGNKVHYKIPYIYSFQIDDYLDIDIVNFLFTIKNKYK